MPNTPARRPAAALAVFAASLSLGFTSPALANEGKPRELTFPGSPARVSLWTENGLPHASIVLDAEGQRARSGPIDYRILLRYATFDPLVETLKVPASLAAGPDTNLHLVQFVTQRIDEYDAALAHLPIERYNFVGNHAFVVKMDDATADAVRALPFVRWVGPFHPAYRLEEPLLAMLAPGAAQNAAAATSAEPARYSIQVCRPGPDLKAAVAAKIDALGGTVDKLIPEGLVLEATLSPAALLAVARLDEVLFIDRVLPTVEYVNFVRIVGGADYLESVAGFTGHGVRGEVMDSNLFENHSDFQAIPPIFHGGRAGNASHGTSVYGIIFGRGTNGAIYRGILPDAQGIFSCHGTMNNRYNHIARLLQPPYEAVFQTNSWGTCCTPHYGTAAADADNMLFDNQLLFLQAQANQGSTSSDAIAFAKNLVSVGGIRHQNTLTLDDDRWQNAGSIGPATDGRIKPDLAFWYDGIGTTASGGGYTNSFGGTSAATPMTAAYFGLMFQMWSQGVFGNTVTHGASVFENRPRMATAKALMINTASPYPFSGAGHDLRRTTQGWGRADIRRLYDLRDSLYIVDGTSVLSNLQSSVYMLEVLPGTPELRATMVYTDRAGTPNALLHRVNDLSLRVIAPDGTYYWGNNGLHAGNASIAGSFPNRVDTVENVWIPDPMPGPWMVEVIADEIVQDTRTDIPGINADYALVVSGVSVIPPLPICVADFNADASVNTADITDFLTAWFADRAGGTLLADFNADGAVTTADITDFLSAWFADRASGFCN